MSKFKNLFASYKKTISPPYSGNDFFIVGATLVVLLVAFITVISIPGKSNYSKPSKAAPQQTASNKITWLNSNWDVTGANVAWYNWGCDFGCGSAGGGVSNPANRAVISAKFAEVKNAGIHVIRWWTFEGGNWQINRDSNGHATGLNPAIYADFDAAMQLAEQYDLYYNFVVFQSVLDQPRSWWRNPTYRAEFVAALQPLISRYGNNPRVMSWELVNEPENQPNEADPVSNADMAATVKLFNDMVHANSQALTTIGNLSMMTMAVFKDASLDYYSPHFYDGWMTWEHVNPMLSNANQARSLNGITDQKPIVFGEWHTKEGAEAVNRYNTIYNGGYAGSWGWTIFPDRTYDHMAVDFAATKTFTDSKTDIGPRASANPTTAATATSIPPTATLSPTPSDTTQPNVSITSPTAGALVSGNQTIAATASDNVGVTRVEFLVDGQVRGTDTSSPYSAVWDTTNGGTHPCNGAHTHTLTARAFDASNNQRTSTSVVVNMNNPSYCNPTNTPTSIPPTATPTRAQLRGDINGDGTVGIIDFSMMLTDWAPVNNLRSDLNNDGQVGVIDFSILLTNWSF